ncbi:MAG TPA: flagellar hook capping FlgD N-terminal domain-containing protein [Rhizomicrobium sp.]|jgi:flagellar basal-body rod modification protein FlgD|nr:flagellar hook capping FlgD N-terminal domain-containing protein [Rhizomicrobium sp.]
MTTVAPTTSTPTTSSTSTQDVATQQLSGNFNTFLTLLTTQLQNQDPMNPMDSDQFTQELVEFSGVEQQINTNDNLQSLISLQQSNAGSSAMGYLGKTVTVTDGSANLTDGEADWSYALGATSASTTLSVTDSSGNTVYSTTGATASGQHDFSWNGEDSNGNQLADGVYKLAVTSKDAGGNAITTAIASKGVVSEVNLTSATPMLMVGNMAVPVSSVSAVDN